LGLHPEIQAKLSQEVRSAFESADDITITSVQHLSYMLAVLDESMRVFPPVASGLPRLIAEGGGMVAGEYVPENVRLSFIIPSVLLRSRQGKMSDFPIRPLLRFGSGLYTTTQISGSSPKILFQNAGWVTQNSKMTSEMRSSHSLRVLAIALVKSESGGIHT
jgi:hypothetical protein